MTGSRSWPGSFGSWLRRDGESDGAVEPRHDGVAVVERTGPGGTAWVWRSYRAMGCDRMERVMARSNRAMTVVRWRNESNQAHGVHHRPAGLDVGHAPVERRGLEELAEWDIRHILK